MKLITLGRCRLASLHPAILYFSACVFAFSNETMERFGNHSLLSQTPLQLSDQWPVN